LGPGASSGPDDLFNYDPEVPVLAPGGNLAGLAAFGPHDLSAQQQSNALLVYTSLPMIKPLTVAGNPRCFLHLASSAPQTDLVVRLSAVSPSGLATFLTLGATRAAEPFPHELEIAFDPIAARFAEGDRIRIDVASSAFPLLARNPNTGEDPANVASPAAFQRALQVIYHNAHCPSRVVLPILNP
jgi:putative CocE/NonD family hydrolase